MKQEMRSGMIGAAAALAVVGVLWGINQVTSVEAPAEPAVEAEVSPATGRAKPAAPAVQPPVAVRAEVPAGTTFVVRTQTEVKTGRAREGDVVTAVLVEDLYAGDELVAEAGSTVHGRVTYVAPARTTRDKAALELAFHRLETPDGGVPISASVASAEIEDRAVQAERNADIAWTVGGAIVGAVIGNQADGGERARRRGRTTGAIIGATTGLIISTQTGSDFTLRPGTRLTLRLNRSIAVR
jgi:hypothetical protein